jgi:lysocardiolipin and lysophospholipid acyltransferase
MNSHVHYPFEPRHRSASYIRAGLASFLLFAPLISVNILQALGLLWKPFAPRAFRRWNTALAQLYWSRIAWAVETVNGVPVQCSGARLQSKENALLICNHLSAVDTLMLLAWAEKSHRVGTVRFFVKDVLKYLPGPGWGMYFLDCIFLKRDWQADKKNLQQTIERYKAYDDPFCWMIFPEGTRLRPSKVAESQDRAAAKGLPLWSHVLIPHSRGVIATLAALDEKLDAVYDATIAYPEGIPTVAQLLRGATPKVVMHVERWGRDELPKDRKALVQWLEERFGAKDQRLGRLHTTGAWSTDDSRNRMEFHALHLQST